MIEKNKIHFKEIGLALKGDDTSVATSSFLGKTVLILAYLFFHHRLNDVFKIKTQTQEIVTYFVTA